MKEDEYYFVKWWFKFGQFESDLLDLCNTSFIRSEIGLEETEIDAVLKKITEWRGKVRQKFTIEV